MHSQRSDRPILPMHDHVSDPDLSVSSRQAVWPIMLPRGEPGITWVSNDLIATLIINGGVCNSVISAISPVAGL